MLVIALQGIARWNAYYPVKCFNTSCFKVFNSPCWTSPGRKGWARVDFFPGKDLDNMMVWYPWHDVLMHSYLWLAIRLFLNRCRQLWIRWGRLQWIKEQGCSGDSIVVQPCLRHCAQLMHGLMIIMIVYSCWSNKSGIPCFAFLRDSYNMPSLGCHSRTCFLVCGWLNNLR